MAGEKNIEVKVGLLVVVCVALLVAFIVILGGASSAGGKTLFLDVDTSAALKVGAPVKVAGVSAGQVTGIEYRGGAVDPALGRPVFVRVTLAIDEDKLATLRRDTRFFITNQGVLGEKYVEIDPISHEGPSLADGQVVVGEPPMRLEIMASNANRVLGSLSELLKRNERALDDMIVNASDAMATMKRTVERVDTLLEGAGPDLSKVLAKAVEVEDELLVSLRGLNAAIGDGSELRAVVKNAGLLASDLRSQVNPIAGSVKKALGQFQTVGVKAETLLGAVERELSETVASAKAILADAKTLTQNLKDGRGTIGALLSDREMYDDIREMMKDLKRHPWKFIWKE